MTDAEIIKAFDDIVEIYTENSDHRNFVFKEVRDLINRLKTESNGYRYKAQTQKGELARLYKQNAKNRDIVKEMVGDAE